MNAAPELFSPYLWPPLLHIVLATWSNNNCHSLTSSFQVILQGISQKVPSCCPWALNTPQSSSSISAGCVKCIARCWHSKGYICNNQNRPASLLGITIGPVRLRSVYNPLHTDSLLGSPWTLRQSSSVHIPLFSQSMFFPASDPNWAPAATHTCSLQFSVR